MLVFNKSIYSYYLKNHEMLLPPGSSLTVDNSEWESDDQLARVIESLDEAGYVFVSDHPDGYPRTEAFPNEVNIIGDQILPTLPALVIMDETGGTISGATRRDPTPVTSYTVVKDDLDAATDMTDYPILPPGYYLAGGYLDWVPNVDFPSPEGIVQAYVEVRSNSPTQYPESDLGAADVGTLLNGRGNYIEAPTKLVAVGSASKEFHMLLDYTLSNANTFTWVRWVFWAVKVA